MRRPAKLAALGLVGAVALTGATVGRDYARAASLVVEAAGIDGWPGTVAGWQAGAVSTEPLKIPSRHGELPARVYTPQGTKRRTIVMFPGVHAGGIDEPRLVGFAEDLAAYGHTVVTVELPDLKRYVIAARAADMIEDAAQWASARSGLAPDGRVGLVGISFAGGLAVVAAGRPGIRDRVAFVLSFGGHSNLSRTLRYLCTGRQPDGKERKPHDYGVVIILLGTADRLVPADQVEPLRRGILTFLEASHVYMVDKARAKVLFQQTRDLATTLPEPARTLLDLVNDRSVAVLGPKLLPYVETISDDPALSPDRGAPPAAPVFLLHGADDNVIPAVESVLLGEHLRPHTSVEVLLTPLITHAEVDQPSDVVEIWKLVSFWADVLTE
jgi:dienelactone hydrolase